MDGSNRPIQLSYLDDEEPVLNSIQICTQEREGKDQRFSNRDFLQQRKNFGTHKKL